MILLHINIILKLSCPIFKNSLLTKYKKIREVCLWSVCLKDESSSGRQVFWIFKLLTVIIGVPVLVRLYKGQTILFVIFY